MPKVQRPRSRSAGPSVVCLGLAEGAKAFCESKLRQDLIAHALSLSHLTFVTTIKNFHFYGSPSFPVFIHNNFKWQQIQYGSCRTDRRPVERANIRTETAALQPVKHLRGQI